ncbi:MAG TPA: hypothetical protein VGC72_04675 [Candidatus Elarobacter sp.]|jgi:hypothetical protein
MTLVKPLSRDRVLTALADTEMFEKIGDGKNTVYAIKAGRDIC